MCVDAIMGFHAECVDAYYGNILDKWHACSCEIITTYILSISSFFVKTSFALFATFCIFLLRNVTVPWFFLVYSSFPIPLYYLFRHFLQVHEYSFIPLLSILAISFGSRDHHAIYFD